MKPLLTLLLLTVFIHQIVFAQNDSTALLKQAEIRLQNNSGVSSVLTDKSYASLHPLTTYRELIRKYSSAGLLSITTADEPGKKIKVIVTIENKDGEPVPDATVYLYQTDSRGWYAANAPHVLTNEGDYRHARLFGYVKTDKNGKFELHTIKPSGYPQSDLPAHIHVHVTAGGYQPMGTEFLFQDDERLKGEILNRAVIDGGIIARPAPAVSPFDQEFSYEIKLRKK